MNRVAFVGNRYLRLPRNLRVSALNVTHIFHLYVRYFDGELMHAIS